MGQFVFFDIDFSFYLCYKNIQISIILIISHRQYQSGAERSVDHAALLPPADEIRNEEIPRPGNNLVKTSAAGSTIHFRIRQQSVGKNIGKLPFLA